MNRTENPLFDSYTDEQPCPAFTNVGASVTFHEYTFRDYCGAYVCEGCRDHYGLGMCFCGWKAGGSSLSPEDRAELEMET
jgi:hypothetical protein